MLTERLEQLLVSIPKRDREIEREIDRKYFSYNFRAESIQLYFDALQEVIDGWNRARDRRSRNGLVNFISNKQFPSIIPSPSDFTLQEEAYARHLHEYIASIRKETMSDRYSDRATYAGVISDIEKMLLTEAWNSKYVEQKVHSLLSNINNINYHYSSSADYLLFHIHQFSCTICIVNGACDEIYLPYPTTLILNHQNFSEVSKEFSRQANIMELVYKANANRFERIDTRDALDWCVLKISRFIGKSDSTNNGGRKSEVLQDLEDCLSALESIRLDFLDASRLRWDKLRLDDVKRVRTRISNTVNALALRKHGEAYLNEAYQVIIGVDRGLRLMFSRITQRLDLDSNIDFGLSEIKRNNALYALSGNQKKSLDSTFGEENLSAVLASNLQCMYRNPHSGIAVRCESRVGNGRSDIVIEQDRKTIAIIESKLIKQRSNVTLEVASAINQLFDRYSENQHLDAGRHLQLYIIIFCHDKSLRAMEAPISAAIHEYSSRNGVSSEILETSENSVKFSYTERRSGDMLSDKVRLIKLVVCNMEVEWKSRSKNRTNLKSYSI